MVGRARTASNREHCFFAPRAAFPTGILGTVVHASPRRATPHAIFLVDSKLGENHRETIENSMLNREIARFRIGQRTRFILGLNVPVVQRGAGRGRVAPGSRASLEIRSRVFVYYYNTVDGVVRSREALHLSAS
jgi:hypothetical protein